jgi:hypothetical protein
MYCLVSPSIPFPRELILQHSSHGSLCVGDLAGSKRHIFKIFESAMKGTGRRPTAAIIETLSSPLIPANHTPPL